MTVLNVLNRIPDHVWDLPRPMRLDALVDMLLDYAEHDFPNIDRTDWMVVSNMKHLACLMLAAAEREYLTKLGPAYPAC